MFGMFHVPKRSPLVKMGRSQGRRLHIESLERRLMMANFAVTTTADSGHGSLRWAMEQANALTGPDSISFKLRNNGANRFQDVDSTLIGGDAAADVFVIRPLTALPALTDRTGGTTIDGRSQTALIGNTNSFGPEVVLDGSLAQGNPVTGLYLAPESNGNRIFGLNIQGFSGDGVMIIRSDANWLAGNYIGTDATGTQARPNGTTALRSSGGILISAGAERNMIGGVVDGINDELERNVISGNRRHGIRLQQGAITDETHSNVISGNYIGVNSSARATVPNAGWGVLFVHTTSGPGPFDNRIVKNVIDGNTAGALGYIGVIPSANTVSENRTLLRAALDEGVLIINGSALSDNILVFQSGENVIVEDRILGQELMSIGVNSIRSIVVFGGAGDDNIAVGFPSLDNIKMRSLAVPVTIDGGPGQDILRGGAGDDVLRGGPDDDTYVFDCDYFLGHDTLEDSGGSDTLDFGSTDRHRVLVSLLVTYRQQVNSNSNLPSNLSLTLGSGESFENIIGGAQADDLRGNKLGNVLRGGAGSDRLYGDHGWDVLFGDAGLDMVFGDEGVDLLFGGPDPDRYLLTNDGDAWGLDITAEDAVVWFLAGTTDHDSHGTQRPGKEWQDPLRLSSEIEKVDYALHLLHMTTGNTRLLKTSKGESIIFMRHGGQGDGTNDLRRTIHLTDSTLDARAVLHEVGHFWNGDQIGSANWRDFLALSGWKESIFVLGAEIRPSSNHVKSSDYTARDSWWHHADATFASDYAKNNPMEDFAESFAAYFLGGFEVEDNRWNWLGAWAIPEKIDLIGRWIDTL